MPLILSLGDYDRWLGDEPDPHDLMRPFSAEHMRMWSISTWVNKPENARSCNVPKKVRGVSGDQLLDVGLRHRLRADVLQKDVLVLLVGFEKRS